MRKLLIGVIILAVLLVVADRVSVAVAENQISDRLTSAYGLAGKPPLHLHLRLTSVHVTPDGLRIGAAARHVQFART
jgi:Flp pilus assembly protein protease CpaA